MHFNISVLRYFPFRIWGVLMTEAMHCNGQPTWAQKVEDLKDQPIGVIVSKSVKKQVINALKNYTDIGL